MVVVAVLVMALQIGVKENDVFVFGSVSAAIFNDGLGEIIGCPCQTNIKADLVSLMANGDIAFTDAIIGYPIEVIESAKIV